MIESTGRWILSGTLPQVCTGMWYPPARCAQAHGTYQVCGHMVPSCRYAQACGTLPPGVYGRVRTGGCGLYVRATGVAHVCSGHIWVLLLLMIRNPF